MDYKNKSAPYTMNSTPTNLSPIYNRSQKTSMLVDSQAASAIKSPTSEASTRASLSPVKRFANSKTPTPVDTQMISTLS